MKQKDDYEIGLNTVAIIPLDENTSRVYEDEEEYIVKKSANSIIKSNCEFYGSSYEGRCVGTKYLTGIKSKFPIIIEESRNIIFFPTSSTREKQSAWLALSKIKTYRKNYKKNCDVIFNNDSRISLDISYYSLDNQIVRAIMLKTKLYERKINQQNV